MAGQDLAFVRTAMLAPQAPPASQRGAVKWLRENLFTGPLNSVLTILAVLTLYYLVRLALPWLLHGVWNANSLGECRTAIAASFGPDASGACWAVIRARWHQFIFGFYPRELWWRPILAFALLFVALAPVLFGDSKRSAAWLVGSVGALMVLALILVDGSILHIGLALVGMLALTGLAATDPMRLLYVSALFPFVALFLLWGGSIWGPVLALGGFGVMVLIYRLSSLRFGVAMATVLGFLAACVWWLFLQGLVAGPLASALPIGLEKIDSDQFGGFLLAFVIGVSSIAVSLPIGILLALGRQSDMLLIKTLSVWFIEFVRGVPLITMLFTASLLLQYFLPPQTNFDLILRVVILVTLFAAAYNAEVVRGGLAALPRGQYEAADALGLDYWQAQRLIVMPQALKVSIPGIVSNFIGLFKDTTLVSFVGLMDPLRGVTTIVRADINWKGIYWEPYIFVGAIFFAACFGMSRYSMYLERKLKTDHG